MTEAGRQQLDVAKQHAATVTATLNAVNAYAEWAPIADLEKYGLIRGYVFFFEDLKHLLFGGVLKYSFTLIFQQMWVLTFFS